METLRGSVVDVWRMRGFLREAAWHDLRRRFRRTSAGISYFLLYPLAYASALAFIFGRLFHNNFVDYVPFVLTGTLAWEALTGACLSGGQSLIGSEGYARHYRLPLALFPLRACATIAAQAAAAFVLALAWTIVIAQRMPNATWLAAFAGLALVLVTAAALAVASAVATTRTRDLAPLMGMAFPVLWLASPVGMPVSAFRAVGAHWLVDWNPFYHLAEWLRAPLLRGEWPAPLSVLVGLGTCALALLLAAVAVKAAGRRFVYWL